MAPHVRNNVYKPISYPARDPMVTLEPRLTPSASRVLLWVLILGIFACGSGVQILMYGGPHIWPDAFANARLPEFLYVPWVLAFFFAPGLTAAGLAVWLLYRFYRREESVPGPAAILVLIILAVVSCYMGVFVSFNTWGT
jgi:uncharacterized membrane protein